MWMDVALPIPVNRLFTYALPDGASAARGMRVAVPLGSRVLTGVVIEERSQPPSGAGRIKPVLKVLDEIPALAEDLLELGKWMSEYYRCSWGEALATMLPPGYKPRGAAATRESGRKKKSANPEEGLGKEPPLVLNSEQSAAMEKIGEALKGGVYATLLLHGVTGSGKTEIYLQAVSRVLDQGRGAIVMVPEISLTPQMRERVHRRFGAEAVLLHSKLSNRERTEAWERLRRQEARVAVGARSAVFAPIPKLGLVVVDEEPEGSYKQEESPHYHARDLALMRAKAHQAVALLGSATPSVETYYHAQNGRYGLLTLSQRVDGKRLPEVRLVDMARELSPSVHIPVFSQSLLDEIEKRLAAKEQTILFLNRRGFATVVMCPQCRHVLSCQDCSVALVYHSDGDRLRCHACGRVYPPRPACPQCGAACVRLAGAGTQRVEEELKKYFPRAGILRLDQDAARKRGGTEETLRTFGRGEAEILIGTQMVAKGMDFPKVTLVGIISADTALHLPDFRAEERAFQLIVQVAGRAGRGDRPGLVLVQTLHGDHPVIRLARAQDYLGFYQRELEQRRALGYPPFRRLAGIVLSGKNPERTQASAEEAARRLRRLAASGDEVLGPAPSPRERIAAETRWRILIKSAGVGQRRRLLDELGNLSLPPGVRIFLDVDPLSMI